MLNVRYFYVETAKQEKNTYIGISKRIKIRDRLDILCYIIIIFSSKMIFSREIRKFQIFRTACIPALDILGLAVLNKK